MESLQWTYTHTYSSDPSRNKLESGQKVESYLILNVVVVVVVVASTVPKKLVGDFSAIFGFHERYTATM